jgi:hypothetical protein
MYFLASDELQGRKTGEMGNLVAARYVAESFREAGLVSPEGIDDYYQRIIFEKRSPAIDASITLRDTTLTHTDGVLVLGGKEAHFTAPLAFVDQGWINDTLDNYANVDLDGKIAIALFGIPGSTDARDGFLAGAKKRAWAAERGAVGMIEIYSANFPWNMIKRFLNRDQTVISDPENPSDPEFLFVLSDYKFTREIEAIKDGEMIEVVVENSGIRSEKHLSPNVVGWLEGSDPDLNDEYVIVSAHFDHVGTTEGAESEDNIFNGARDNAIGTSAIIMAAQYFSKNRPKRSLLFIGFTAEEIGLLGSGYYADHPVKPLDKAIFNLNTDGAGYNDTTRVTIIGHDRVGVLDIFTASAQAVGLNAFGDPVPEQGLFDRSDNVNFAKLGIPAPTYSPGITAFDQELMKFYHQTADNPDNVNYNYLKKFIQSYILSAEAIANIGFAPKWKAGDKYEEAYMKLYNK